MRKIGGVKWSSFKNGVAISKERKEEWVDNILDIVSQKAKANPDQKNFFYHTGSGDSVLIANFYRLKKGIGKFYTKMWMCDSSGFEEYENEKLKLF